MPKYRIYGFTLSSDIALPAIPEITGEADADVQIRAAPIAESAGFETSFRNWEAEPGRFFATFFETGRFRVSNGDTIEYDRVAEADDSQVVSILLGTCMAALLMQRGILPIHSCSVLTDKGAVLVMGMSGAGKSTMLGGLLSLGLPMVADDVTGLVYSDDGTPQALPAFPATRLWADSLKRLGHERDGLPQVRSDLAKYYRPVAEFHDRVTPIRAIVYLQATNAEKAEFARIDPALGVECLSRFIHRKNFIEGMKLRPWAFRTVADTVGQVPIFHLKRPAHWIDPSDLARRMIDGIEEAEAESAAQEPA